MDFLNVMTGVLVANALTAMLIYGFVRLDRNPSIVSLCCFLTPLGFAALGAVAIAG